MFKKVKSLIIAGLLVVGMGFATVDSYAAEKETLNNIVFSEGQTQIVETLQQGHIIVKVNKNNEVYDVVVEWDKTKVDVKGIESFFEAGNSLYSDFNTCYDYIEDGNKMIVTIKDVTGVPEGFNPIGGLTKIDVTYEILEQSEDGKVNNPPIFDFDSISDKYIENMSALGSVSVDGTLRTITKDAAISKNSWEKFVEDFNKEDNGLTITWDENDINNERGFYSVYIIHGDQKELIENISIEFYDVSNKGWLPEITPGTGQALAVGGIVIGTVAVAGLFVNNKRKKDEE